ncbi:right-handed parallel beta-helix repeat-containing protein [Angustibacter aerolatus]
MHVRTALTAAALGTLALVATALGTAAPASARAGLSCGDTVTSSRTLTRDLTCEGLGLVLAPGVTLDLGGHTVRGNGSGTAVLTSASGTSGVKHGTVRGWATALLAGTGSPPDDGQPPKLVVSGVTVLDNGTGASAEFGRLAIDRSTFRSNGGAVFSFYSDVSINRTSIRDSDFGYNGSNGSLTLRASVLDRNDIGVRCTENACSLRENHVSHSRTALSTFAGGSTSRLNVFSDNDVAVSSEQGGGVPDALRYNRFDRNKVAVRVDQDGAVLLERNVFQGNGTGITTVAGVERYSLTANRNVLTRNRDAIVLPVAGAQLGGNVVVRNTRRGVYAPGAVDLGGNTAFANGSRPQCTGVDCRRS